VWHLIVVGVAALIIGFLVGNAGGKSSPSPKASAGTSTSTTVSAGGAAATSSTTTAASTYAIGQTADIPGWSVTVYAVHSPQPAGTSAQPAGTSAQPAGTSAQPAAGFHFVSVDVGVVNTSTLPETWSSTISLHLLDAASHKYAVTPTDIRPPIPVGVIQKGGTMRGLAVFAVPNATTIGLRLLVQGSATATGVTFKLS